MITLTYSPLCVSPPSFRLRLMILSTPFVSPSARLSWIKKVCKGNKEMLRQCEDTFEVELGVAEEDEEEADGNSDDDGTASASSSRLPSPASSQEDDNGGAISAILDGPAKENVDLGLMHKIRNLSKVSRSATSVAATSSGGGGRQSFVAPKNSVSLLSLGVGKRRFTGSAIPCRPKGATLTHTNKRRASVVPAGQDHGNKRAKNLREKVSAKAPLSKSIIDKKARVRRNSITSPAKVVGETPVKRRRR